MECIGYLQGLLAEQAGDALLWAAPPVLRAAREQMQQAIGDRQALEAEASNLGGRLADLAREREVHKATLDRDADTARVRVARQDLERQGLEFEAARIREKLAALEAESASLESRHEGAQRLEQERSRPQTSALNADIEALQLSVSGLRDRRLGLDSEIQEIGDLIAVDTARLELHKSRAQEYEAIHNHLMEHDAKCADIRAQIEALALRRDRQVRAAHKNARRTRKFTVIER